MKHRVDRLQSFCNTIDRKRVQLEQRRLISGLAFIGLIIVSSLQENTYLGYASVAVFLIFISFIKAHKKTQWRLQFAQSVLDFYKRQHQRIQGTYLAHSPHLPKYDSAYEQRLSTDLDLFGASSIFETIDESFTQEGKYNLANKLLQQECSLEEIKARQEQIKRLKPFSWRLLRLTSIAKTNDRTLQFTSLRKALENPIDRKREQKMFTYNLFVFTLAIFLTTFIHFKSVDLPILLPFGIFALVSFSYLGRIHAKFKAATSIAEDVKKIAILFEEIESRFDCIQLRFLFEKTITKQPSQQMKELNRILSFMSVQGHPLVHLALNAVLPWDQVMNWAYEKWRLRFAKNFKVFIDELRHFEEISSGVYLSHFHKVNFPEVLDKSHSELSGAAIRHPLIEQDKVVSNSFDMGKEFKLGLITGSNMAGKSTFLRTLGVNHLIARLGFPVFAENYTTSNLPLFTSLRITDSLEAGFSSFYTEAKTISEMVVSAEKGNYFFYLIDEIFRGTNNKERFIGSQAVIKSLAKTGCTGLISSHDLELAKLVDSISEATNWHFSEKIEDSEMSFSYKVTPGPCQSTNALVILKQLGLQV